LAGDLRDRKARSGGIGFNAVTENFSIKRSAIMPSNIFYIIGVVVVILFILGYLGLR
jgi:hypothetical protein